MSNTPKNFLSFIPASSPWAIAAYRRLQLGNFVLNFGRFVELAAQSWLVYHLTGDPAWVGLHALVASVPMLVFAIPAGVLADRFDRRKLVFAMASIWAVLAIVLAVLGTLNLLTASLIIGITLLEGFCASGVRPVLSASLQDVVGREHLPSALAANSFSFNIARMVGPALGGVLIDSVGPKVSFMLNAAAFTVVLSAFYGLKLGSGSKRANSSVLGEVREAISYGIRHKGLRRIWWTTAAFAFLAGPVQGILVVFVDHAYGSRDASDYGSLLSAMALGALAGAGIATHAPRYIPRFRIIPTAMCAYALAAGLFSLTKVFHLGVLLMVMVGVFHSTMMVSAMTAVQLLAPEGMRGRIISVQMTMFGTMHIGSGVAGLIASRTSAPQALSIFATIMGLIGIYTALFPVAEIDSHQADARAAKLKPT